MWRCIVVVSASDVESTAVRANTRQPETSAALRRTCHNDRSLPYSLLCTSDLSNISVVLNCCLIILESLTRSIYVASFYTVLYLSLDRYVFTHLHAMLRCFDCRNFEDGRHVHVSIWRHSLAYQGQKTAAQGRLTVSLSVRSRNLKTCTRPNFSNSYAGCWWPLLGPFLAALR